MSRHKILNNIQAYSACSPLRTIKISNQWSALRLWRHLPHLRHKKQKYLGSYKHFLKLGDHIVKIPLIWFVCNEVRCKLLIFCDFPLRFPENSGRQNIIKLDPNPNLFPKIPIAIKSINQILNQIHSYFAHAQTYFAAATTHALW